MGLFIEFSAEPGHRSMRFLAFLCIAIAAACGAYAEDVIVVCPVQDMIDEGVLVIVKRAIKEAEELDAKAIFFHVDTPGGRVDSAVKIAAAIGDASCQTIAFIDGMGAISAGALISFSCNKMVMTQGSNIGAATPVIASPQGMLPTSEKEVSFMRAKMRALAESNGHNPDIAHAMVDKDIELRGYLKEDGEYMVYSVQHGSSDSTDEPQTKGEKSLIEKIAEAMGEDLSTPDQTAPLPVVETPEEKKKVVKPGTVVYSDGSELVLAQGKLLTLTPGEALKYGVIEIIAEDMDEAAAYYGLEGSEYYTIEFSWAERAYRFLTNPTITGLLLMLGIGGLYFEVKTPGFGVPGIIAITSLTLLFGSHYVLGLTDVIDVILLISGLILILVEIFVLPGFGIAGVAGLICLSLGMYLALVDFTIPQYTWHFDRLNDVAYSMFVAFASFAVLLAITWRYLPRTPLFHALVMGGTQEVSEGYVTQTREDVESALGLEGVATSMLRPAGRGRFGDKTYDVVARGDFIDNGTRIKIVEVEGNRHVVDELTNEETS